MVSPRVFSPQWDLFGVARLLHPLRRQLLRLLLSVEASRPTAHLCKWSRTRDRVVLPTVICCCLLYSPSHRATASGNASLRSWCPTQMPFFRPISPPRGLSASVPDVYLKKASLTERWRGLGSISFPLFVAQGSCNPHRCIRDSSRWLQVAPNHTKMGSSACNRS